MQIVNVRVENIKGVRLVEFHPNKTATLIGGKNRQGKSSLLDAICMAIGGKRLAPARPLRDGQERGEVVVDVKGNPEDGTQDLRIKRTFVRREDGSVDSDLIITSTDNFKAASPQKTLNDLIGVIGFDPLAFLSKSPKEQADALRELVGVDTSDIDSKRAGLYAKRQEIGVRGKEAASAAAQSPERPLPEGEDLEAVNAKLAAADAVNKDRDALGAAVGQFDFEVKSTERLLSQAESTVARLEAELAKARESVAGLTEMVATRKKRLEEAKATYEAAPSANVADLHAALSIAHQRKAARDVNANREKLLAKAAQLRKEYADLTKQIEACDVEKSERVAKIKWPLQGLDFNEAGVLWDGRPLEQASTAEQIRVSVAIAAASGRKLNCLFFREGSLLDDEMLETVVKLGAEYGCQLFIELVGENDINHVTIKGGEVSKIDPTVAPSPLDVSEEEPEFS